MKDMMKRFLSILATMFFTNKVVTSLSISQQSSMSVSFGFAYSPREYAGQFLSMGYVSSPVSCAARCHSILRCRIYDHDSRTGRCRLFEGDINTMGQLVPVPTSSSRVGSIRIMRDQFTHLDQPCLMCLNSRYMVCVNETCQCPVNTYFDGNICQAQRLSAQFCRNASECRSDLNYTCLPRMQCGLISLQNGETVGSSSSGVSGTTLTALSYPVGIAFDSNHSLYVADYGNHRIIRFELGSKIGEVVAGTGFSGNGTYELNGPQGIDVDEDFNMYVVDSLNHRVMLWLENATDGIQIAGTGLPDSALDSFNNPNSVVVDSMGNFYVSDVFNHRVMKWSLNETSGTIVAGTGIAGNAMYELNEPAGLFFDEINSYLYIADSRNHRIQRYELNANMTVRTVAGGNSGGTELNQFRRPADIFVSKKNSFMFVSDFNNQRIQIWRSGATSGLTLVGIVGFTGTNATFLNGPASVLLNHDESFLYVSDFRNHRIQRFQLI